MLFLVSISLEYNFGLGFHFVFRMKIISDLYLDFICEQVFFIWIQNFLDILYLY